ncbi:MAG: DUF1700 domain-containing protein [Clostridiales bacterium]|jgi:uncharacterized membrane protein|nr:DUF1700 domain-containing protein [Clostridiales bacterium]
MNRREYLRRLEQCMKGMPPKEVEDALRYYEDYFEDGSLTDEEIITSLGKPEDVARQIRGNAGYDYSEDKVENNEAQKDIKTPKKRTKGDWVLIVIIIICLLPIVLPVIGSIIAAVLGLLFAAVLLTLAFLIGGLVAAFSGIGTLFVSLASGLVITGLGIVSACVGILLCRLLWYVFSKGVPAMAKGVVKICKWPFKDGSEKEGA